MRRRAQLCVPSVSVGALTVADAVLRTVPYSCLAACRAEPFVTVSRSIRCGLLCGERSRPFVT